MEYEDLSGPDGQADNMGGTTQRCFLAPITDFESIKKPMTNPLTPGDLVKITTAHTFKSGKGFIKVYCTMDKGKVDAKSQGETDGKSLKLEAEIFLPGSEADAHGFASMVKNDNFIALHEMPDSDTKGYIQNGTEAFPCKIDPDFSSGTNSSGVRGYIFKMYSMSARVYIYTGTITLKPAESSS